MTKEDELGDPFFRHSEATFILRSLFSSIPYHPKYETEEQGLQCRTAIAN